MRRNLAVAMMVVALVAVLALATWFVWASFINQLPPYGPGGNI